MSDEDGTVVLMAREAIMDDEDEFDREENDEIVNDDKKNPRRKLEVRTNRFRDEDALDRELEQENDDFIVDDDEDEDEDGGLVHRRRHKRSHHRRHRRTARAESGDENEEDEEEVGSGRVAARKEEETEQQQEHDNEMDEHDGASDDNERERHRQRKLNVEDLDEEDLELINENLGLATTTSDSHLRRIKKGRRDREEGKSRSHQVDLNTLFEDEDRLEARADRNGHDYEQNERDQADRYKHTRYDHHRRHEFADEMDDFIQDDTDEERDEYDQDKRMDRDDGHHRAGAPSRSYEEGEEAAAGEGQDTERRARPRTGTYGDAIDDMADIFGHDYEWALDGDDDDEGREGDAMDRDGYRDDIDGGDYYGSGGLSRRRRRAQLKDVFEPSELKERMMTEEDDEIRLRDIPERLQLLRGDEINRTLSDSELAAETLFITSRMRDSLPRDLPSNTASDMIRTALVFINRDNLEVPYIDRYKRDYFEQGSSTESETGLTQQHLWRILDLDVQWRQLRRRRDQLKTMLSRLDMPDLYAEDLYQRPMELADKRSNGTDNAKGLKQRAASGNVWERAKGTPIMDLVKELGITSRQFADNYEDGAKRHHADDPAEDPLTVAQRYTCSTFPQGEFALKAAKEVLARQIAVDPTVRHSLRRRFEHDAIINVHPTDKGRMAIDETHAWYPFKYLRGKLLRRFEDAQFLEILQAERDQMVTIEIMLPDAERHMNHCVQLFISDNVSETADKWNNLRRDILDHTFNKLLLPAMAKWARDWLCGRAEEYITNQVNLALNQKFDCAPKWVKDTRGREDRLARVLAVSWGHGDIKRDPIHMAFVDERGRLMGATTFADLRQDEYQREFMDLCAEHKPDLVLVAGFNVSTRRLKDQVFQLSPRAKEEFPDLYPLTRYCIAVARHSQRPIEEYCALDDSDLTALPWHPKQHLLSKDKLKNTIERGLCKAVSKTGVDLIRATESPAQARMLSYVCGLGPRKANHLIRRIETMGIAKRSDLLVQRILTKTIFINCAAYLRIVPSRDILDTTRIHPSHYDLARKMAADALDVDDPHDEYGQPSEHVHEMITSRQTYRLDELILEDTRRNWNSRDQAPFRELHTAIPTRRRHCYGTVTKVQRDYANAQLESGLDGLIMRNNANETEPISTQDVLRPGENVSAAVIKVEHDRFLVELSLRQSDLDQARHTMKYEAVDPAFDRTVCEKDEALIKEIQARSAATQASRQDRRQPRRTLQHPLFRNVTAAAAEAYLDRRHIGDCVIRPSYSRGSDHMVVVWKVHDGIYKHIEIIEQQLNAPGRQKRVFKVGDHMYSDLDEMVVLHVEAMTNKVNELREHQRFHKWILARFQDNSKQIFYGFCPNAKRPDGFRLNRTDYVSVTDLINGFKAQVMNAMKKNKAKSKTSTTTSTTATTTTNSSSSNTNASSRTHRSISTANTSTSNTSGMASTNSYMAQPPPPPPPHIPPVTTFYGHHPAPLTATTATATPNPGNTGGANYMGFAPPNMMAPPPPPPHMGHHHPHHPHHRMPPPPPPHSLMGPPPHNNYNQHHPHQHHNYNQHYNQHYNQQHQHHHRSSGGRHHRQQQQQQHYNNNSYHHHSVPPPP
ncbi:hypothetical protein BDF22DRAFT_739348 [Syncephalis plumigaleata]|nr:hypothetical protein BDF22DRAFT_739348 [Syncephalis plumigaleata]